MRLSWNEIRVRAADFDREWADAAYEKDETQRFYNEFFDIFGVRRRTVARYKSTSSGSTTRRVIDLASHLRRTVPVGHGAGRPPRPGFRRWVVDRERGAIG